MSILKTSRRLRSEDRSLVLELVSRLTAGDDPRPRPDLERLSEGEAVGLVELCRRINAGAAEPDGTFWRLVAAASGFDRDHFTRRAEEAKAAGKAAERDARERRLNLSRREESGFVRAVGAALHAQDLWADDLAVLTIVLAAFATGRPFAGDSYFVGSGRDAVLHLDFNGGSLLGPVDGQGSLDNHRTRMLFLADEGWIRLEGRGPQKQLALGPKLREALDNVPVLAEATS